MKPIRNNTYAIKDRESGVVYHMTLPMIIEEINRDRSDNWTPYDETDWQDGLTEWTNFTVI